MSTLQTRNPKAEGVGTLYCLSLLISETWDLNLDLFAQLRHPLGCRGPPGPMEGGRPAPSGPDPVPSGLKRQL